MDPYQENGENICLYGGLLFPTLFLEIHIRLLFTKVSYVVYLSPLSQGLCEIPVEMEGRLMLKGYFQHGVWWRHMEVSTESSRVSCQCCSVMGDTGIGCAFLVGDTLRICWLHSFGRCRSVWKNLLLYACIAFVHDFPRHAVYFSLGSVWVFRQCLIFFQVWERRFQHTVLYCLLFGLSCIWEKRKALVDIYLFIFNCILSF